MATPMGPITRVGDVVSLSLGQRCGSRLLQYVVSFDGRAWRLGPPGTERQRVGSGIGSGFVRLRQAVPTSESHYRGYFSTTSSVNDSGTTAPRPRPPAGTGPNVAATMKTRWLEGSRPMLRDAGLVCTVSAT